MSETDACAALDRLVDVLERQARRLGELLLRRLATELDLEPARRPRELLLALDDVDGHTDRARVIRDRPLHRLPDPPGRIRRELEPAAPVELLDRAVETERSLLDQVEERDAETAIALGDRDDQTEVRLDHVALRNRVAALDALCELHLLCRVQQLVAPDVGKEELEGVRGAGEGLAGPHRGLRGLLRLLRFRLDRRADLEPHGLELARHLLDLFRRELLLGDEGLELGRVHPAALLGAFQDRLQLLGLEQFDELVLRQAGVPVLSLRRSTISLTLRAVLRSFHEIRTTNRVTSQQRVRKVRYSVTVAPCGAWVVGESSRC